MTLLFLAACGGGSGGGSSPSTPAPTSLSYSSPQVYSVSQPIAVLSPTVTGTVSSYTVSPALPPGLVLNGTTGAISGTPTTPTAAAIHQVTASNSSGATTANISITVNDVVPSISYAESEYTFVTGVAPSGVTPVNTGGASEWSIAPALPAGLVLNTTDGTIAGVPTTISAATTYTVTAQNSGGADTFDLSITVDSGTLLDLGHHEQIAGVYYQGNRALSVDTSGHWVLWNATTAASITQGTVPCEGPNCRHYVDLAGTTIALQIQDDLQLRDADDGALVATVTSPHNWFELASDGSYIATGSVSAVSAYSRSGTLLFTKSGDYSVGRAFAAPNELRVAAGAGGATTLEKIAVPSGSATTEPFTGTFHSWFGDGERFLTNSGNTVWVFNVDGTQEDLRALSSIQNLGGRGDWFWVASTSTDEVNIYSVGASATPTATFTVNELRESIPSGDTLGVFGSDGHVHVIDLSGATPSSVDYTVPQSNFSSYGALSSTQWLVGNSYGVLVDAATTPGSLKHFGWGTARSIAANSERIAIATASGSILLFDAETRQRQGSIDFASSKIRLSADGTLLVAMAGNLDPQHHTDRSLKFFSLPSGNVLRTETSTYPTQPYLVDFELSESGQTFSRVIEAGAPFITYTREAATVSNGNTFYSDVATFELPDYPVPVRPSPTGSMFAVNNSTSGTVWNPAANVYQNDGTLLGAAAGWSVGWIDANRLLLHRYDTTPVTPRYLSSVIANSSGQVLHTVTLIDTKRFQTVSSDSIYAASENKILSLTDGEVLWETSNVSWGEGGVTGTHVIFGSGATVRAEPY